MTIVKNPCSEIQMTDAEFCTVGPMSDYPKTDPKRRYKKKLENLSNDQLAWLKEQAENFGESDKEIYVPDYGRSFFGQDVWVSKKLYSWYILHYGTDQGQLGPTEILRRLQEYMTTMIADDIDAKIRSDLLDAYLNPTVNSFIDPRTKRK